MVGLSPTEFVPCPAHPENKAFLEESIVENNIKAKKPIKIRIDECNSKFTNINVLSFGKKKKA